jgi:aspartate aminotransferase-like enzyme
MIPRYMASQNLRTPGPTPLPAAVREALAQDMIAHRGPEFAEVMRDCLAGLKWAFQTEHDMLVLTASGSGGLESMVSNTLSPGEKLLAVSIGYFGDRLIAMARAFGVDVVPLRIPEGQAVDPNQVAECLTAEPDIQTVFVTHNETSTGVLNPLPDIARAVRQVRPQALLLVDGISSVGSVAIQPDAWDLDVVVAGSQKGWMIPPGLAFVSISPRAWERQAQARLPRAYFDWQAHKRALGAGSTPWTPAVGLFVALQAGLRLMQDEGLDRLFERHAQLATYTRDGLTELGLRLLADPAYASPTVTTAFVPDGVEANSLIEALRTRHGVVLAGGQGGLEGKIIRVAHLGWVDQDDLDEAILALRIELNKVRAVAAPVGAGA